MTLYQELVANGIRVDNHYSDLYVPATPEVQVILALHPQNRKQATTFVCQVTGDVWYDVPFAYDPFWTARGM